MNRKTWFIGLAATVFIIATVACSKKESEKITERALGVRSDKETMQRLEEFLDIPIYPNAKLADIFTERRDDQIPEVRMDARVTLIIDDYDKVPKFYEEKLGMKFKVEGPEERKYYTLKFDKGNWEYEIFVGHDTYMNQPTYDMSMWAKEE